jgi:ribosome-associated toxin RatA of RatAB toxin-antitoxin module
MMAGTAHRTDGGSGGRSSARRLFVAAATTILIASVAPAAATRQDEPLVSVNEEHGVFTVDATFSVPEASAVAFKVLTDYADIPRFMPEVRTSQVLERTDEGAVVEQEAVARFMMFSRRVHLVLEVQESLGTIRFRDRCGKSFSRYEGSWVITENGGTTQVRYELVVNPSFDVPEFLLKRLLKRDARQMIERLRTEIATRARESKP